MCSASNIVWACLVVVTVICRSSRLRLCSVKGNHVGSFQILSKFRAIKVFTFRMPWSNMRVLYADLTLAYLMVRVQGSVLSHAASMPIGVRKGENMCSKV